jgi:hypothetical protein
MQLEYVDTSWTVVSLSIGMGGIEILTYDWLVSVWLMLPPVATYLKYLVVGSSLDLAPLWDLDRGGTTTPLLLAFEGSKYILCPPSSQNKELIACERLRPVTSAPI